MKRLLVFVAVVCACLPVYAQSTHQFGSLDSTNIWVGKNTFNRLVFCNQTVSTLPASPSPYEMCWVTDGATSSTCQTGLGTNSVLCYYVNRAWIPVPGGGGGGGGNTTSTGMNTGNFPVATGANSLTDSGVSGTTFNGAGQLVQMTLGNKLPSLDGSLLTNLANAPTSAVVTQNSSGFLQGFSNFTFSAGVLNLPTLFASAGVTTLNLSITGLSDGCLSVASGAVGSSPCPTGSGTVSSGTTAQFPEYPSNGTTVQPSLNLSESAYAGTAGLNYAGTGLSTFSGLLKATGLGTTSYTISQLSGISSKFASLGVWITDGVSLADCTVGGSSTAHYCYYTGSTWISGGGGSGTVNSGATGAFAFYGSSSPTVSASTQLTETSDTGAATLNFGGAGGVASPGGFTSTSGTTDGILVLTKRGVGNFSLDAGTVVTPYGWHAPTADAAGILHSPGSGTPTAPSQLTLGPVTVADASTNVNGNGTKFQLFTGSAPTTNDCAKFDANGNVVDAGAACSSPGLTIQTNGVNNSSQATLNVTNSATTNGSNITATNTGTGVVQLGITGTLATPQGNGGKVQLSNGTATTNDCVKFDANGNTVDSGAPCGSGSMVYPGAGVPNSTGSAWGSSYTVGTAANNLVQLNGSAQLPAVNGSLLTSMTSSQVGLGSVTNDAQTKAAIMPNTAPAAGRIPVGNVGGTAYAPVAESGDCTLASTGAQTCTKTSGVSFAASATTDTTNASNISSGTLNNSRLANPIASNTTGYATIFNNFTSDPTTTYADGVNTNYALAGYYDGSQMQRFVTFSDQPVPQAPQVSAIGAGFSAQNMFYTSQTNIGIWGDSHFAGILGASLTYPENAIALFRNMEQAAHGTVGEGFASVCNGVVNITCLKKPDPPGATITQTGNDWDYEWQLATGTRGTPFGLDGTDVLNTTSGSGSLTFTCNFCGEMLIFIKNGGSEGTVTCTIDGSASGPCASSINMTSASNPWIDTGTLSYVGVHHVVVTESSGVNHYGGMYNWVPSKRGVLVSNFALGSAGAAQNDYPFATFPTSTSAMLTQIGLTAGIIGATGSNECVQGTSVSTFATNLHTLYLAVQAALPSGAPIYFATGPDEVASSGCTTLALYEEAIRKEALADGTRVIDIFAEFSPYTKVQTMLGGSTCYSSTPPHLSNQCAQYVADLMAQMFPRSTGAQALGNNVDFGDLGPLTSWKQTTGLVQYELAYNNSSGLAALTTTSQTALAPQLLIGACKANCGASGQYASFCDLANCEVNFDSGGGTVGHTVIISTATGGMVEDFGSASEPTTCLLVVGSVKNPPPSGGGKGIIDMSRAHLTAACGTGPQIVYNSTDTATLSAGTGAIHTTTMISSVPADGEYTISFDVKQTTAGGGTCTTPGSMSVQLNYTDADSSVAVSGSNNTALLTSSAAVATVAAIVTSTTLSPTTQATGLTRQIRAKSGTALSFTPNQTVASTGTCSPFPVVTIRPVLTYLGF